MKKTLLFINFLKLFLQKYRFQVALSIIIIIAIIIIVNYIQKIGFVDFYNELRDKDKPFYLVHVAIVLAAISTAIFTWWKNALSAQQVNVMQKQTENILLQTLNSQRQIDALQSQIRIQEETRVDSLFSKALDLLNETNDITTRKSGIHILKDIALTNPKHTQKCIDMLCSINELWMPWLLGIDPSFFQNNKEFLNIQNIDEVITAQIATPIKSLRINMQLSQLVLKVMSQIIKDISNNSLFNDTYDLSYKYLCSISLSEINFTKFDLNHVNFENAFMYRVDLSNKIMWRSVFKRSYLIECNFENSQLPEAFFDLAKLNYVNFKNAYVENAYFIRTEFLNTDIESAINFKEAYINNDDNVRRYP